MRAEPGQAERQRRGLVGRRRADARAPRRGRRLKSRAIPPYTTMRPAGSRCSATPSAASTSSAADEARMTVSVMPLVALRSRRTDLRRRLKPGGIFAVEAPPLAVSGLIIGTLGVSAQAEPRSGPAPSAATQPLESFREAPARARLIDRRQSVLPATAKPKSFILKSVLGLLRPVPALQDPRS